MWYLTACYMYSYKVLYR